MQEFNDQIGRAAVKTGLQRWHIIAAIISECRTPCSFVPAPTPTNPSAARGGCSTLMF